MEYRQDIDSLKGIAIIAVVLFHLGLLESGYLGVDIFFVINGFLLVPSVCKAIDDSAFSFFNFMEAYSSLVASNSFGIGDIANSWLLLNVA